MCFSVNVNLVKEEIEDRYGISFPGKYRYEPSYYYHAFGLPELPSICSGNPSEIRFLKWGLIPSWVKTDEDAEEIRIKTFNARADSLASKPSFSYSFKSKRCIIPVRGFYEWQHIGKVKIPWYIYPSNDAVLSLAGLFSEWTQSGTGEIIGTFSIITTDANEMMAEIHNSKKRMPAILDPKDEKLWINLSISTTEAQNLLKPCPVEYLKAHTISPLINNRAADRNSPEIIKPYDYKAGGSLF